MNELETRSRADPAPAERPTGPIVLIIDDHELFATALRIALCGHGVNALDAPIACRTAFLEQVRELTPGLALLDLHLGRDDDGHPIDGVELVRPLRSLGWTVLALSYGNGEAREAAAVAAGAVGLLSKTTPLPDLLVTVDEARAGRPVMPRGLRETFLRQHHDHLAQQAELARRLDRLSPREWEVLRLLTQGRRARDVAAHLVVSMTTVRTQIRAILAKLEVTSQLEAVALIAGQPYPHRAARAPGPRREQPESAARRPAAGGSGARRPAAGEAGARCPAAGGSGAGGLSGDASR